MKKTITVEKTVEFDPDYPLYCGPECEQFDQEYYFCYLNACYLAEDKKLLPEDKIKMRKWRFHVYLRNDICLKKAGFK